MYEGLSFIDWCRAMVLDFLRKLPVQKFHLAKKYHRNRPLSFTECWYMHFGPRSRNHKMCRERDLPF